MSDENTTVDATASAAADATATAAASAADEQPAGIIVGTTAGTVSVEDLTEALMDVVDPELGIDVVNLGLIYGIHIDESDVATIDMTLTSAACPLTDVIEDQAKTATDGLVKDLRINWVWMPPWGPDKITDDGREQLRALGFNV
ncbi:metal-sulfur cluster biosynthetic enzyme [Streptomyces sp. 1114.5]|nr:metal-sulfur cluster biosynthetic enzyme [Streptomyces sp. 1114.5]SOB81569.1 Metal-sulfur cluster biosynthetic enzyme [Streptomyces sp. 1331.2]